MRKRTKSKSGYRTEPRVDVVMCCCGREAKKTTERKQSALKEDGQRESATKLERGHESPMESRLWNRAELHTLAWDLPMTTPPGSRWKTMPLVTDDARTPLPRILLTRTLSTLKALLPLGQLSTHA